MCSSLDSCSIVVVKAEFPQLNQRAADMEDWLHLQVVNLNVRTPNTRVKRKDRRVHLSRLCQRMTRAKRPRKGRKQGRKLLRQQL